MAKYKLNPNGVTDTETGACIPEASDNRHWVEYQEWLAEGNVPDPDLNDYLAQAKAVKCAGIWAEANRRIDAVGAGYTADSSDTSYPAKATRKAKQHLKRLTKLAKGQALNPAEEAEHDAYDVYLDWADAVGDAAVLGCDAVELAVSIEEIDAVVVTWPV